MANHVTELRQRGELVKILKDILAMNDEFRAQMPAGFDGDLLTDACDDAKAYLQREGLMR